MATLQKALEEALKQAGLWPPSPKNHEADDGMVDLGSLPRRTGGGVPLAVYLSQVNPELYRRIDTLANEGVLSPDSLLELESEAEDKPGP